MTRTDRLAKQLIATTVPPDDFHNDDPGEYSAEDCAHCHKGPVAFDEGVVCPICENEVHPECIHNCEFKNDNRLDKQPIATTVPQTQPQQQYQASTEEILEEDLDKNAIWVGLKKFKLRGDTDHIRVKFKPWLTSLPEGQYNLEGVKVETFDYVYREEENGEAFQGELIFTINAQVIIKNGKAMVKNFEVVDVQDD
jgi:hypothetical protein